ncbi:hypothetical protein EVAR_53571_1 [Eumeta japonica]|uniref:Uncharacterized protein n=1 Tax=Eumeta variegata TaxID=151549 RepID=A0A4C1YKD9_EUMVA|nr:hypothetical protein EVAR_53571_1 [Eumeta japonica]
MRSWSGPEPLSPRSEQRAERSAKRPQWWEAPMSFTFGNNKSISLLTEFLDAAQQSYGSGARRKEWPSSATSQAFVYSPSKEPASRFCYYRDRSTQVGAKTDFFLSILLYYPTNIVRFQNLNPKPTEPTFVGSQYQLFS